MTQYNPDVPLWLQMGRYSITPYYEQEVEDLKTEISRLHRRIAELERGRGSGGLRLIERFFKKR